MTTYLGMSFSGGLPKDDLSEISLNCTANDFLVDYKSIEKEDIFNILKDLMKKYNMK